MSDLAVAFWTALGTPFSQLARSVAMISVRPKAAAPPAVASKVSTALRI